MTTRVGVGGPSTGVLATETAPRVTPEPTRPFRQVMNASSPAIISGAEAAVTHLPGGSLLAAAMRPGGGTGSTALSALNRPEGPTGTAISGLGISTGSAGLGGVGGVGGAGGVGGVRDAGIEQVMTQDADQNLYYLKLQEQMGAESRSYSAISNVLKARHDTMKNAIGNIR